jgi:hypothetical protein
VVPTHRLLSHVGVEILGGATEGDSSYGPSRGTHLKDTDEYLYCEGCGERLVVPRPRQFLRERSDDPSPGRVVDQVRRNGRPSVLRGDVPSARSDRSTRPGLNLAQFVRLNPASATKTLPFSTLTLIYARLRPALLASFIAVTSLSMTGCSSGHLSGANEGDRPALRCELAEKCGVPAGAGALSFY